MTIETLESTKQQLGGKVWSWLPLYGWHPRMEAGTESSNTKPIDKKRKAARRWKTPRCEVLRCKKPQEVKWTESPRDGKWIVSSSLYIEGQAPQNESIVVTVRDGVPDRVPSIPQPMSAETWYDGPSILLGTPHGMCHPHARLEALRRWSLRVRTGRCELAAFHAQYNVRCAGSNVAGHGFGKGAYPSVMFELWNGFSKCSGLNAWVEDHTLEWDGYLRETWGDKYDERRAAALQVRKYDLAEVLSRLAPA